MIHKYAMKNFVHMHSFLLGINIGVELLGHELSTCLPLEDTNRQFTVTEIIEKFYENFIILHSH